jgi:hypothetical protein
MAFPVTKVDTLQAELDSGDPTTLGDVLQQVHLGTILTPLKRTFTITASATADLTALDATGETTGTANPNRLAALAVTTLRVTASGTATSLGAYIVTDAGGTAIIPPGGASAAVGIALISDDGKTITFPNTVTGFVIEYVPRSATAMTATYNKS